MYLMPNNHTNARGLSVAFPNRWGLLMSPDGKRNPGSLPWAIDNGMFGAWKSTGFSEDPYEIREAWDGLAFLDMLAWAAKFEKPRFVVVPDCPGNGVETIKMFSEWREQLGEFQLAMAVQDGMIPSDVPPDVVCFIGGTTDWKWQNLDWFAAECPRVHVARVNTGPQMWKCHRAGVESVDGSGWFRGDQKQTQGIIRYCRRSSEGLEETDQKQLSLL